MLEKNNDYELELKKLRNETFKLQSQIQKLSQEKDELETMNMMLAYYRSEEERIKTQYLYELLETRKSLSFRVGLTITKIPRLLLKKLQKNTIDAGNVRAENTEILDSNKIKVYPYMITIVTAVYNTAPFLREMVDSIVEQELDGLRKFLTNDKEVNSEQDYYKNIWELILVDDGSTDSSVEICDEYSEKYANITVIHKENGGVSSARNAGIAAAKGKYINFADSDDKLSNNVLVDCLTFFEKHYKEITLVTFPNKFFDAQNGDHWTNTRFSGGTRIIDSETEWDKPLYFTNSTIFKTEDIKGKIKFDSSLINGEDTKFLHEVYYRGFPRMGAVHTCTYWYRRRSAGEQSAIQMSQDDPKCYLGYINNMLGWLINAASESYGKVPKYVQNTVMGQLQWKLRQDGKGKKGRLILGDVLYDEYRNAIKNILENIDYDVIVRQPQIYREHIFWAMQTKLSGEPERLYNEEERNIYYLFNGTPQGDAASCYLQLEFMKIADGKLYIEGVNASLEEGIPFILCGEDKIEVRVYDKRDLNVYILSEMGLYAYAFKAEIPLDNMLDKIEFRFGISIKGMDIIKTNIRTRKFMPISRNFPKSYYLNENWVARFEESVLTLYNAIASLGVINFENEFIKQVAWRQKDNKEIMLALDIREEILQLKAWRKKNEFTNQIWLVSDQVDKAGDNGEAFFRFLSIQKPKNVDAYFVISKDCSDYERMQQYGKVLEYGSKRHVMMHLLADLIVSAHADEFVINPVWRKKLVGDVYRDMLCKKYVFLQHGIIMNDLSSWLNRYNKNISGFVCGAIPEAKSILHSGYYYEHDQVWLTGLARYDRLYHNEQRYITVMPTWRKYLSIDYDSQASEIGSKSVSNNFKESDFFDFYNSLLNDERLLNAAEIYNYTLCFMPHPTVQQAITLFDQDERVMFFDGFKSYTDVYAESNMVITDYSSSAMDFAWLKKPVVYVQFDKERFFSGEHTLKPGYFDYEKSGFGEVVYDLDTLIDLTIDYMKNECELKAIYNERLDKYFGYFDQNNCERIYNKICGMMGLNRSDYELKG